jgi:pimeloyl-ACP methyl ester carboxylesterase
MLAPDLQGASFLKTKATMQLQHARFGSGAQHVLLLSDWFGGRAFAEPMMQWIDGSAFTYVLPDYRGYGASLNVAGDCDLAEMAADVLELAEHLGWSRFHVVGHSMSGKVVQLLAASAADRLLSAVAITPTPPIALPLDSGTWDLLCACEADVASRKAALAAALGGKYSEAIVAKLAGLSMQSSRPDAYRRYLDAWSKTDIRPFFKGNSKRLRIILGANDPFVPETAIKELVLPAFPQSELIVLNGIGHYPPLEASFLTASLIEEWFRAAH